MIIVRIISYAEAIREALIEEMERDERVVLLGEDIGVFGGVYKVTKGLYERFGPSRVIDTPISEDGFAGMAIGMAIMGLKPVVEVMYPDFLPHAANQIINFMAKIKYTTNGVLSVPMVIRTTIIQGRCSGPDHSQVLIPIFMHIPGLQIIAPSNPYDAKGLLKSAIRSHKPTLFFEAASLYSTRGEVPPTEYLVPIGEAKIIKSGEDITLISFSTTVKPTLEAAEELEKEGIKCEVVDLRTLVPMDLNTIINSVRKTKRLVVVESSWPICGVGAEVLTSCLERGLEVKAFARVSPPHIPEPMSPALVKHYLVNKEKVISTVKKVMKFEY
jgi:pyruvate dehydrogenase E1 component beta subunit